MTVVLPSRVRPEATIKRALLVAMLLASVMHVLTPAQGPPADALKFFKNYFVTGSYVVGGVGLRGKGVGGVATGAIRMNGAPEGADLVAAFLYWQVVTKDDTGALGAARVTLGPWSATAPSEPISPLPGIPLSTADGPLGKTLGAGSPPCWSGGGGTGSSGGAYRTFTYRTDVLRFLHIDDSTGKFRVNGYYQVQLPDDNNVTALGASLVVIYRDPDPLRPLNAIVLYDGNYTMDQSSQGMYQSLKGFYDGTASGKLTHIVGSGQANKSEILRFNGTEIARNPFTSTLGANWDNPTYSVSGGLPTQVTTSVDHEGFSSFDCLTWAAVIYEAPVRDTDGDGLLDAWETSPPPVDPQGQPLPDLAAMGASPFHKDAFVEIGYMTTGDKQYGGVAKPAHSHRPTHAAIKLMGDAFKNSPLMNPDGTTGIALHVDAGPNYPQCTAEEIASQTCATDYLVAAPLARGGEALPESITTPPCTRGPDDPVWKCQLQQYPGTVGWKTGFQYIKDEVIGTTDGSPIPPPPTDPSIEDPCDLPGNKCVRRFDRNRSDAFHYAFFAHAVGMPKSLNACLDQTGAEQPDVNGHCPAPLVENPLFFTPRTNSGIGDFPGRDVLISLGAFSDRFGRPGGTDFMVASTWFHELGHNMALRHGAWQDAGGRIQAGPNCVPTYLSAMNYLYQLRGLLDDLGRPNLDFAGAAGSAFSERLNEAAGTDAALPWTPQYRIGWYAPLEGSYFVDPETGDPRTTVAGRHCDGSPLGDNDVPMVRVDARTASGVMDWNANGIQDGHEFQDLNFNGRTAAPAGAAPELPQSFNDWANIRLNQIGAARNVGGPFLDELGRKAFGPLSADLARADWARADWARADWARADWARADWARADWGDLSQGDLGRYALARADWARADWARADWARADWARADWGRGDDGRADWGGGDLFINDPYNQGGELDFETATLLANTPPYQFSACIGSESSCGNGLGVLAKWKATNEGNELRYILYRVNGSELAPGQAWTAVTTVEAVRGQTDYSFFDASLLERGAIYLYFAVAVYDRMIEGQTVQVQSDPSNLVAIEGPNHPAVASADSYTADEDTPLTQAAPGVLGNDTDVDNDTLTAVLVTPPSHGTLNLNADGSFTYTPAANYNGGDSFTYRANDAGVDSAVATVSIAVRPVNDVPVSGGQAVTVVEDTPTVITLGGLDVDGDALTYTITTLPAHGTLGGSAPNLTYTPALNFNGLDGFTFTVRDGTVTSAPATVAITVTPVNDGPVAVGDSYPMPTAGGTLTVPARGVLANDTDVDSPAAGLTAVVASGPSRGALVLNLDGSFTYTPTQPVSASDSFTYRAKDGGGALSNVATVRIAVYSLYGIQNVPPVTISKAKAGSSVPMKWQFRDGSVVVNSSSVGHTVTVRGPLSGPITVRTITNTDPGSSTFRYDGTSNTWYFNLQTKETNGTPYPTGLYEVTITPNQPGYLSSPPFNLTLTK